MPFTIAAGAVIGGTAGAALGAVEGAVQNIRAAQPAQIGPIAAVDGAAARYGAGQRAGDSSKNERPPEPPSHLQYIGEFEAQGGLPYHKFGKMFLDATSVREIDPAKGEGGPSRTADFVVNYWSQETRRHQSYVARAAVECAPLWLRIDRWVEHAEPYARGSAPEEHSLDVPTIVEGHAGNPDSTVTKGVKAACAAAPLAGQL